MSFISYTAGIPNPPNNPSVDVPTMQTNSNSVASIWTQDHFGFNNNAGGYHKYVHLKNTSAPGGLGANANAVFYANISSSQSWPFWQNALGSFQLIGAQSLSYNGYTNVGGIIIEWGSISATNGNPSVSFPLTFPTNLFNVQVTRQHSPSSPGTNSFWVSTTSLSTSGFTIINDDGHSWSYNWMAIGN